VSDSERAGALDGLRVLDVGLLVQGPQAAQLLGDLGADVVKVELPEYGDQGRWIPLDPKGDARAPWFIGCNRGKRSLTLDLRKPRGQEVFHDLAALADVVVSNFLPGTLEGWGLGYEALAERNPRLIYAAGSAYGPEGPDATRKGADLGGQAQGGLLSRVAMPGAPLASIAVTIADHIGSQNLVAGVLAALYARERTGRGQKVEVSLYGGQIFAQASELTAHFLNGVCHERRDSGHPLLPYIYGVFPTADGHIVLVGVHDHAVLWAEIGRPELSEVERFNREELLDGAKEEAFEIIGHELEKQPTAEWERRFRAAEIRYAPVRDYAAIAADEGAFANGYLQRVEHPEWGEVTMPGCPIRLSDTPAVPGQLAPELGQHTEEVLLEAGLDWEAISKLRADGVT